VLPYLAMSLLYKRSNWLWYWLIRAQWTAAIWRPLVEATRRRHVKFRRRLAQRLATSDRSDPCRSGSVVSAGV
jgi:hypothetical protein